MAIVMISDAGTDTVEQYDQIIKQLDEAGHGNPLGGCATRPHSKTTAATSSLTSGRPPRPSSDSGKSWSR